MLQCPHSEFLKSNFPEALYIDLLKPDIQRKYQARPETIIEVVEANPDRELLIVDEIQKVPELLSAIHSLIEANFNQALKFGLLPIVYLADDPASTLETYIALYIQEEVQHTETISLNFISGAPVVELK